MASLDTNVLLRWLLQDVPEQTKQVDALLSTGQRFRIDDAALIEVVFVLERVMALDRSTICDAVDVIISTSCLDLDRPLWGAVCSTYADHPKLSVTDIYLALRAARAEETPLLTFDRKMAGQLDGVSLLG